MNFFKVFITTLFCFTSLTSLVSSQDDSYEFIELIVKTSGQYTFSDWNNYPNLWTANVIGNLSKNYYIEMKFYITEESAESGSPDIWGISQKYDFPLNNNNFTYDYMFMYFLNLS